MKAGRSIVPAGVPGLGTVEQVEQVEPESAVVDGGGLAWQEFAVHAKLYGKVVRIRSDDRAMEHWLYHFWWYYRGSRCHGFAQNPQTPVKPGWGGVRQRNLSVP